MSSRNVYDFFSPQGHDNESCILCAVQIFLSLTTVTVTAGNSACEVVMFSLIFVNELAVFVDLFPFYTSMDD